MFKEVHYIDDLEERFKKYDIWTKEEFERFLDPNNPIDKLIKENFFNWFFLKRRPFEHEKEYRCLVIPKNKNDFLKRSIIERKMGIDVKIENLGQFIEEIIISPYADNFYEKTIKETLEKMNYSSLIEKVKWSKIRSFIS